MTSNLRKIVFIKITLCALVGFLALAGLRPFINTPVEAQSPGTSLYVEPGIVSIRKPDGGSNLGDGKMVIDLKTGDVWGFPTTLMGSPYPVDPINPEPPVSKPIYLGRFDFSEMKAP